MGETGTPKKVKAPFQVLRDALTAWESSFDRPSPDQLRRAWDALRKIEKHLREGARLVEK